MQQNKTGNMNTENLSFSQCPVTRVLWIFILLLLAACQGHQPSFPPELVEAEGLANAYPDSALSVLRTMNMNRADVSEETRMLHRLLTVKAEDKLYVLHSSDSLMLPVVRFYEKRGDKKRLAEALKRGYRGNNVLLCMGSICHQKGDADSARYYFREVVKHGDFRKQCSAYGSLSELEDEQGNHSKHPQAKAGSKGATGTLPLSAGRKIQAEPCLHRSQQTGVAETGRKVTRS